MSTSLINLQDINKKIGWDQKLFKANGEQGKNINRQD